MGEDSGGTLRGRGRSPTGKERISSTPTSYVPVQRRSRRCHGSPYSLVVVNCPLPTVCSREDSPVNSASLDDIRGNNVDVLVDAATLPGVFCHAPSVVQVAVLGDFEATVSPAHGCCSSKIDELNDGLATSEGGVESSTDGTDRIRAIKHWCGGLSALSDGLLASPVTMDCTALP